MLKMNELLDLVERYERFLTWFAVSVLRMLGEGRPAVEQKLLAVIRGTVMPVPFGLLCRHLERMNDPDMARVKTLEALMERHKLLSEVAEFLGNEVGKEFANKPLLDFMARGDDTERAFSMAALATFGHSKAVERLQETFAELPHLLRWGVLVILEQGGDRRWMPLFLSALDDSEEDIVCIAVKALGKSGLPNASNRLQRLLKSDSELVAVAAVQAVATLRDPGSAEHLLTLAKTTENDRVRATAVSALGAFPSAVTQKFLSEMLTHSDTRTRANAAVSLKRQFLATGRKDESIIERIKKLLQDEDHRVKADAVQTLWELGCVESMGEIERLLENPDEKRRASGAYLCGKLRLIQFKDNLVSLTDDKVWNVRKTAAIALLGLGSAGNEVLRYLLVHGSPEQQICAAYVIGLTDDPKGVDMLLAVSNSETELGEMATDLLMRLSKPVDM